MTRFLTVEEMVTRFGEAEMLDLAGIGRDRSEDGRRLDQERILSEINVAEGEVRAKIISRYPALDELTPENAPELIKGFVGDIARYYLRSHSKSNNQVTDVVYDRYKRACKMLDDIQMRRASVDMPEGDAASGTSSVAAVQADFAPNRADELLHGYLS